MCEDMHFIGTGLYIKYKLFLIKRKKFFKLEEKQEAQFLT